MESDFFDYAAAELEHVPCNLCQADDYTVLNRRDRYGFPVVSVICKKCGLIYLNPRMSKRGYQQFYERTYRHLLSEFHHYDLAGHLDGLFEDAQKKGALLLNFALPFLKPGLTIDVGSSCGGLLALVKEKLGTEVLGIEPSPDEAAYAQKLGIPTRVGLVEDFTPLEQALTGLPPAQNILIARSLNHLLDPRGFFTWAHQQLVPGGSFVTMTYDFVYMCQVEGRIKTQLDHPYMFSEQTLINFIRSAGFRPQAIRRRWLFTYVVAERENVRPFEKIFVNEEEYQRVRNILNPVRLKLRYHGHRLKKWFRQARRPNPTA